MRRRSSWSTSLSLSFRVWFGPQSFLPTGESWKPDIVAVVRFHNRMPLPCAKAAFGDAINRTPAVINARDMVTSQRFCSKDERGSQVCKIQLGEISPYPDDVGFASRGPGRTKRLDMNDFGGPPRQEEQPVAKANGIVEIVGDQQRRHNTASDQGCDLLTQPRGQRIV